VELQYLFSGCLIEIVLGTIKIINKLANNKTKIFARQDFLYKKWCIEQCKV